MHEHDEDQGMDQNAELGRLALSVGDHGADHGQHARQVIGHGVRNQEEHNEKENLRHLYYIFGKKWGSRSRQRWLRLGRHQAHSCEVTRSLLSSVSAQLVLVDLGDHRRNWSELPRT